MKRVTFSAEYGRIVVSVALILGIVDEMQKELSGGGVQGWSAEGKGEC